MAATTSVTMASILNFGSRPTSDKDDRVIYKSGLVKNTVVKVEIAAPSLAVQKVIFTYGLLATI